MEHRCRHSASAGLGKETPAKVREPGCCSKASRLPGSLLMQEGGIWLGWCPHDANKPRIWVLNPKMSLMWTESPPEQKFVDETLVLNIFWIKPSV